MKNSKKHNKLGVKFLASVLSVITFSLVTTPYAKAKEVGSGNSVVRRIKKVGLRANESAKGVWTKIWTWMKNNPKKTIAIGVVVALAVSGAVGFACYKSNKGKKEKERLEAARKAEEEAARKEAEEAKKAAEEKKEEEESEKKEKSEEDSVVEEATEGQEGDSKPESVVADEAADKAAAVEGPAPETRNIHWKDPKQRQELLNNIVKEFEDFCTELDELIRNNRNVPNVVSQENLRELQSFRDKIGGWIVGLKENQLGKGFRDYYNKESGKIFGIFKDLSSRGSSNLSMKFVSAFQNLSGNYDTLFN